MRVSNRSKILDAAIRVVDRDGVTGVTFDSVAAEAEVTRGGMLYHFKSREELILAINQHLADRWEATLIRHAGKPLAETTQAERHVAYVRASMQVATRAELLFLLEFSNNPEFTAPWDDILGRWAIAEPVDSDDSVALSRFVTRLAADGLWAYEYLATKSLSPAVRQRVADELIRVIESTTERENK